ncbi:MAG: mismatch repair protein MutL [Myxococcaceae bacterium]|nr:mismatch repair protein MutL [Myxococcaceae bacterium]
MPRIHILDNALADQIAAGEVVERPASVIKELLENALDAGARAVTVEVRDGGSTLLRVTDDGWGMDRQDAQLAVLRHATSKIRAASDLERIATLGFRGEALPSIASVSRFRLITRTRDAVEGTEVSIDGGATPQVSPAGCAVGTTIEVRELFYNTPARKKFLKGSASESAHISEVCLRAALIDEGLRLTLVRDGRRAKEFLPASDWAERARLVLEGKAVRIESEQRGVSLRALLSAPEEGRTGASGLHVFVNGRPVRDRNLARSVAFAYGSVLPPGRFPTGVVHLALDPSEVDVNVHPQKAEVRFQRGREVHEQITRLLAKGLGTSGWAGPQARAPNFWSERLPVGPLAPPDSTREAASASSAMAMAMASGSASGEPDPWGLSSLIGVADAVPEPSAHPYALPQRDLGLPWLRLHDGERTSAADEAGAPSFGQPRQRALAQVKRLYIVAESETGITILDQHAADERIQYDRLRRQFAARAVVLQRLLLPERVELSAREAALVEAHGEEIARAGIEVSLIGPESAAIHAVPAILKRASPERLLRDLLDELSRSGDRGFGDSIDTALATMACHGAIRAGDALSLGECQALLDGIAKIEDFGGHCPHGRPILLELPFGELARKVGR